MKLDSRIIEGKRPLSCMDTDEAKQFIGKQGYFANCLRVFKTIEYFEKWTLTNVDEKEEQGFRDAIGGNYWNYFLPAEWVKKKEPEPVWKPYDLDSLREDNFTLGHAVVMRQKFIAKEPARIYTVMYLGHSENAENLNDVEILLGNTWFSVQRLLDDFEIFDDKYEKPGCPKWRPFGYQE
jgi:hypothetical protein